jgi:hypothetical protein
MGSHVDPVRLAAGPEDYARFGLKKGEIEPWEDGLRLDPGAPNIEWWYFDSLLDDGAKLSVIHCTKDASRPHQPLEPLIEIDLDLPDGRRMSKYGRFKARDFAASKDGCDVHIGDCHFIGDLREYHVTGAAEDLSAEVRLESITEPWRPETGHLVFGPGGETIFAWAPFVPMGKVTATYRQDALRVVLHRAFDAAGARGGRHGTPGLRLGHPAGPQPRDRRAARGPQVPRPRPGREVLGTVRRGAPHRGRPHHPHAHPGTSSECSRPTSLTT